MVSPPATLPETLGAARYDRDLLVRQVLAVQNGMADGTAPEAWRMLLRTALWMAGRVPEAEQ